jgi:hypothetical protein
MMADGWIMLSSQKTTEPVPLVNKMIIADADMDRVATWAAVKYFPNGVDNGDGTARNPTGPEVFKALTDDVYKRIKGDVDAWFYAQLREQAEATVAAQFVPVALTPAP